VLLLAVPFCGYGFAWVGHFFYERNKPATFKHPWYSLIGDFAMFRDILLGRISL
jgi:Predicted membrane protein